MYVKYYDSLKNFKVVSEMLEKPVFLEGIFNEISKIKDEICTNFEEMKILILR
jgi:hypothetical protein